MTTITENAVPAMGRTTADEMIAFVVMAALLAIVPLTGLYPYFVMQALCFALFACAFNLLIGYSGLLSFGHAMFLGTAGYVTAHALKVWGVSPEIGSILVQCANLVGRALPLMQSMGENVTTLTALTEEITRLEGRVDDLNDIGLKELFIKHRDGNTMDFVVGAEIYKHLEKVSDRFDDVANEINSIVIEQV
jgi:hypothetical protein